MSPVIVFHSLLILLSTFGAPTKRCSIEVYPFTPGPRESYFWAVFTDHLMFDRRFPPGRPLLPGHWSSPDTMRSHFGQVVNVGGFGGAGRSWFGGGGILRTSTRAVVVLWDYDAGCDPTPFVGRRLWGVPGDTAYFRASPRPRMLWIQNTPTFDVYWGGEAVRPHSATFSGREREEHLRRDMPQSAELRSGDRLTALEGFELVFSLPGLCDYFTERDRAVARLRAVKQAWMPRLSDYAVESALRVHDRLAEGVAGYWSDACRGGVQRTR